MQQELMVHFNSQTYRQCITINQWSGDCHQHDMKVFFLHAAYVLTTTVWPQNYYLILLHCLPTNQFHWALLVE